MNESKILVEHDGDDLLYVGALEPAIAFVKTERDVVEYLDDGIYHVNLCDSEPLGYVEGAVPRGEDRDAVWAVTAEWGRSSESAEEAWRYAIAALIGPVDDEYVGDEYWARYGLVVQA